MTTNCGVEVKMVMPTGYDISSIHFQSRQGVIWYIVWTCKLAPDVDIDHRKHFGRGESNNLNEASDRALRATQEHERLSNRLNLPIPKSTHDAMSDLKLEDLF